MKIRHDVLLKDYTSLHVGGPAQTLIELTAHDDLAQTLQNIDQPIWIIGSGTNCLISDRGLSGTVIVNHAGRITQISPTRLRADSGVAWDDLVVAAIEAGLYGLEFTSGVPGTVGAAVVGNIAAYGQSVAERLVEAYILDTTTGTTTTWYNRDFAFNYRSSELQKPSHKNLIVLHATFELSPQPTGQLEYDSALRVATQLDISADSLDNRRVIILETRQRAGSILADATEGPWTAGSFFKNPIVNQEQARAIAAHEETKIHIEQLLHQNKIHGGQSSRVSAAHVLLAAGFQRGQQWGNVRLHPDHILKIENTGDATAQEIYNVVQEIIKTVRRRLGIRLDPEVRFLGEFNLS